MSRISTVIFEKSSTSTLTSPLIKTTLLGRASSYNSKLYIFQSLLSILLEEKKAVLPSKLTKKSTSLSSVLIGYPIFTGLDHSFFSLSFE